MSLPLVPVPRTVAETGGAPFRLHPDTPVHGDARSVAGVVACIARRTGVALRPADVDDADAGHPGIRIEITADGDPEGYRLSTREGGVHVRAHDAAGAFYAVRTLEQLLRPDAAGWILPAAEIDDAPRFAYRGMMLDVARHFFPVDTVVGVLDRAASLKLNHLHLHLSDDQGWRLALRDRPMLTAHAAASAVGGDAGGFYSREDYRTIIAAAAERHIVIVPEIDVPGHTHAVGVAYPQIAEDPVIFDHVRETVTAFGGGLPRAGEPYTGLAVGFSSLRIDDRATDDFLADVFGELAGLTPGPYLHFGGDEALGTDPAEYAAFVARASTLIADLGKIPVAWHEAGVAADLHPDTVGQYWGFVRPRDGADDLARAFAPRGGVILSPADAVYLDMKPYDGAALGLTWADGATSLARAYAWEPAAVIPDLHETGILGVEAPLWTETVRTLADIDALAFPRLAAAAEAAWSPATGAHPDRTWESFRARVRSLRALWDTAGIAYDAATFDDASADKDAAPEAPRS
ncbi:family 20 glycosylhydrolase [Microbacterium sp. NPDC077184]|uniref:family 20 glycosylhydrolase n=1 Tax=Microbacterium sp. NPDC077184 TaxID=3154764 RepID=UPI003445C484